MEIELNRHHKEVLALEAVRRKRKYKEGWLYYLCQQKGLLRELQELQNAGLVGDLGDVVEKGNDAESLSPRTRLTVELVPSTCWFSNLRSELSKEDWDRLRRPVFERAGHRCEVCGSQGTTHPVECHEVWQYDDERHIQRLAGLVALCPACHEAKHIGLASATGGGGRARAHLARINGWSMEDVELYLEVQFEQWARRSQHEWSLDLSWLQQFGINIDPRDSAQRRTR